MNDLDDFTIKTKTPGKKAKLPARRSTSTALERYCPPEEKTKLTHQPGRLRDLANLTIRIPPLHLKTLENYLFFLKEKKKNSPSVPMLLTSNAEPQPHQKTTGTALVPIKPQQLGNLPVLYVPKTKRGFPIQPFTQKAGKLARAISSDIRHYIDVTRHSIRQYGNLQDNILGIDITPHCIYVCEIDGLNGKRVLTSLSSVCMEGKFMTEDIITHQADYARSLRDLIQENNIRTKNVALSIPVSNSIVRTATLPAMDDIEIKRALKFGSLWDKFMHPDENPDHFSIFYQVLRRKKNEETMDILFVATRLQDIRLYTDIIEQSGLNPMIIDVRCFAIGNAMQHKMMSQQQEAAPTVFLEFGFEENYAMIVENGKAVIFEIAISDAERITLIDREPDEAILTMFVNNYINQVSQRIGEYEKKTGCSRIRDILVMSSVPLVQTIIDKMAKTLDDYTFSECNVFDCMKINDDFTISVKSAKENLSAWAAAIGAGLRRISTPGATASHTNFATPNKNTQQARFTANFISVAASVTLLFFAGYKQIELNRDNNALSEQLSYLHQVQSDYNAAASEEIALESAQNDMQKIEKLVLSIAGDKTKLQRVHEYLNLVILDDVWLKELKFTAPDKLEIKGAAINDQNILAFISLLNQGNYFAKISLKSMRESHEAYWGSDTSEHVKNFELDGILAEQQPEQKGTDPQEVLIINGPLNSGT